MEHKQQTTKDCHLSVRITPQTDRALRIAAEQDGRRVSDFVVRVLQTHLAAMVAGGSLTL